MCGGIGLILHVRRWLFGATQPDLSFVLEFLLIDVQQVESERLQGILIGTGLLILLPMTEQNELILYDLLNFLVAHRITCRGYTSLFHRWFWSKWRSRSWRGARSSRRSRSRMASRGYSLYLDPWIWLAYRFLTSHHEQLVAIFHLLLRMRHGLSPSSRWNLCIQNLRFLNRFSTRRCCCFILIPINWFMRTPTALIPLSTRGCPLALIVQSSPLLSICNIWSSWSRLLWPFQWSLPLFTFWKLILTAFLASLLLCLIYALASIFSFLTLHDISL